MSDEYTKHDDIMKMVREHYEYLESRPQIEKVMSELENLVIYGKKHLLAWRQVYDIVHSEPELIELAAQFFWLTSFAHIQTATLIIAKLTENNSDSVNLFYLFNLAIHQGRQHFPKNYKEVHKAVVSDLTELKNVENLLKKIKDERDKRIAHLDRGIISSGLGDATLIEVSELEDILDRIDRILDKYYTYYQGQSKGKEIRDWKKLLGSDNVDDLFDLVRKSLDNDSLEDVSDHVRSIQSWRQSRLWAERVLSGEAPEVTRIEIQEQDQDESLKRNHNEGAG
jgi:hypothetical protein